MAGRLKPEKAKAIAAEYILNGFDKRKALLKCGYSESYINTSRGLAIFNNEWVKSEIDRQQAKIELKTDFTVEYVRKEMIALLEDCKAAEDRTNRKGAVELMARHKSMLSDNLNTTDVSKQAELAKMSDEEREELKRIANIRLTEMTQVKVG